MGESDSLRSQIVNAALHLFLEHGYQATTLQEIIDRAKCSKGGFYHHFTSKEDLLYLLHETFISYELERGEKVSRDNRGVPERLHQVIIDLVESIELYRPHVTVFFEERRYLTSEKFALIKEKRDRYESIVRELLEQGMRTGEFRPDLDARVVCLAIFGMCNWTYQWFRPEGRLSARQVAETFSRLVMQGLLVNAPGPQ